MASCCQRKPNSFLGLFSLARALHIENLKIRFPRDNAYSAQRFNFKLKDSCRRYQILPFYLGKTDKKVFAIYSLFVEKSKAKRQFYISGSEILLK